MTSILKQAGLPSGAGWDKLELQLEGLLGDQREKAWSLLVKLRADLILAGTKDAFLFELDEAQASAISDSLATVAVSAGNFSPSYPRPLSETGLAVLTFDHELVDKVVRRNGDVSLVFCARRTREDRVTYGMNEVTEAVRSSFVGFDQFIAIKRIDYQVFDVLTVRRSLRRLEVLVDFPDRIRPPESAESRCLSMMGRLAMNIPELQTIYQKNSPINLAPCISGLYQAKTEGRVSKLSFRTPTKSVNRGAMTSKDDLRNENFHRGGVEKAGQVTPNAVSIVWDQLMGAHGSVGVELDMPVAWLNNPNAYVRHAKVDGALSDASVVAVLNKLVAFSS
jgi:hypothetical protein